MPYRIDIADPSGNVIDILMGLEALDFESTSSGVAAIVPDSVTPDQLIRAFYPSRITISTAMARDNRSVWLLSQQSVRIGSVLIDSPQADASSGVVRLIDSPAFGSGHHPTTALCIEALDEILSHESLDSMLDVGTGSGILALVALRLGVPRATGLDIDAAALRVSAENARLNHFADRFELIQGGPESVNGTWPLVVANIAAAPLIDMASTLVRRVRKRGRLILSGIPSSLEREVKHAFEHLGIGHIRSSSRGGWVALIAQAPSP